MDHSTWITANGAALSLDSIPGHLTADRGLAFDTLGWVKLCESENRLEVWVNPLKVTRRTMAAASDIIATLQSRRPGRELIVRVHDRHPRGTIVARSVEELPQQLNSAIELTSQPGWPLVEDRLDPAIVEDVVDERVHEIWAHLEASGFALTSALVERVEASKAPVKLLLVGNHGAVQLLAHDAWTQMVWDQQSSFVGRFLDDLPIPVPLARSLRADIKAMLACNGTVVSYVRGLATLMSNRATVFDSFFRITVPLVPPADARDAAALVILSNVA